jgi:chorismate mutase
MFIETEKLHSKVRRFTSPEEHAFFPSLLPVPILPALDFPNLLKVEKSLVDVNAEIMPWYIGKILKRLCAPGDDEQHGSSVLCDIMAMQAISRRVHMGKFVAESKFAEDPDGYISLLNAGDVEGVLRLLTNVEVEKRVLRRAYLKASTYGQDLNGDTEGYKVDPMLIADIYREMIIPLTKDVEVRYLFRRINRVPPPPETYYEFCKAPIDAFDNEN